MSVDTRKLRELHEAATPGPWEAVLDDDPRGQPVPYYRALVAQVEQSMSVVACERDVPRVQWPTNARLIAELRNALPELLATLEAQERRVGELGALLGEALDGLTVATYGSVEPERTASFLGRARRALEGK